MKTRLQHSHIAIRKSFDEIAARLELEPESGVDDLGKFKFGDINLLDENDNLIQRFRFAQHHFDAMTHLLAEHIHADDEIAFVLHVAGVRKIEELSISKNEKGLEVRDKARIFWLINNLNAVESKRQSIVKIASSLSLHGIHFHR